MTQQFYINKDEFGLILYCFELYFAKISKLIEGEIIKIENQYKDDCPICRCYSIIELISKMQSIANKEKAELNSLEYIENKHIDLFDMVIQDFNQNEFLLTYFNCVSKAYQKGFYKRYTQHTGDAGLHERVKAMLDGSDTLLTIQMFKNMERIIIEYIKLSFIINQTISAFALELLERMDRFFKDNFDSEIISIGDRVIIKNNDNGEIQVYKIVDGLNTPVDGTIEKITAGSIMGRAMLGRKNQEIITVQIYDTENSFKVLDIEKDETEQRDAIFINITNGNVIGVWEDYSIAGNGNFGFTRGFIEETSLHRTGYSIWDGGRPRSREERWSILTAASIPNIGIEEVVGTIQSHIRTKAQMENASIEWQFDLDKLKKYFYRKDKIDYFG